MRTDDIIRDVAKESGQTITATKQFYEAFCDVLEKKILDGDEVAFRGLFMIKPNVTQPREVKCHFDGKVHKIPERKSVTFKISSSLKKKLIGTEV